jgi:hydroxyacylglutathione hydrolase
VIDESLLIGHESFAGWLEGGLEAWERSGLPVRALPQPTPEAAREAVAAGATVIDVREPDEYAAGHIEEALPIPLGRLQGELARVPRDRPVLTYCAMGERATTAASILERGGFEDVRNLDGGFNAWRRSGQKVTA